MRGRSTTQQRLGFLQRERTSATEQTTGRQTLTLRQLVPTTGFFSANAVQLLFPQNRDISITSVLLKKNVK